MKSPAALHNELGAVVDAYGRLERIHAGFEGAARELEGARAAPLCIRCGRCCSTNTVHAWQIEGQFVRSTIAGNGSLARIQECCRAWLLDSIAGVTTYGTPPGGHVGEARWSKFREELNALMRSPCPFYADKACSLYRARPVSCRAYGVTRMTSPDCGRPIGIGETQYRRAWWGGEGGLALQAGLQSFLASLPATWRQSWFLPTLLYQLLAPRDFAALVDSGRVATAKLLVAAYSPSVIWQSQVDRMRNHAVAN